MFKNKLLLGILSGIAAYWFLGYFAGAMFSWPISTVLLVFGLLALYRYGREAYFVVFKGLRSQTGDGSHIAVLGMTFIAAGSVFMGGWGFLWNMFDQPAHWIGTAHSSFGRALMTVGFALMYYSPDIGRPDPKAPPLMWLAVLMIGAVLIGYFVGRSEVDTPTTAFRTSYHDRPLCPVDRPVWGNASSGIYHLPNSPYRHLTYPNRCFKDTSEAHRAGFRPPLRS